MGFLEEVAFKSGLKGDLRDQQVQLCASISLLMKQDPQPASQNSLGLQGALGVELDP